ncbi:hypothetical protein AOZ75_003136 [Salmonella enterica subsp. enterica serovar Sandiego]|nr:hypothetical protein [Salmonella enterica subsp. enterica serovar Sandiego]
MPTTPGLSFPKTRLISSDQKGAVRRLFYALSLIAGWQLTPYPAHRYPHPKSSIDFASGQGGK